MMMNSSETRPENKMMIPQSRTSPSPSPVNSSRANHQPATSEWCFIARDTGTATLTSSCPKFATQWTASVESSTKGSIRLFLSSVSWSRPKPTPSSPTASQWSGTMSLRPKSSTASSSSPSSDLSLLSQRPAIPLSSSPRSALICSLFGRRRQSAMLSDCIISLGLLLLLSSSDTISGNQIADWFPSLLPSTLFPLHRNSVRWKNNFTSIMTAIFHRRTSTCSSPWHDHKDAGRAVTIPFPPHLRSWYRSSDASRSSPAINPHLSLLSVLVSGLPAPASMLCSTKGEGRPARLPALWQTWDNHSWSSSVPTVSTSARSIHWWPRPQATWWWDHWDLSRKDIRQNEEGPQTNTRWHVLLEIDQPDLVSDWLDDLPVPQRDCSLRSVFSCPHGCMDNMSIISCAG